MGAILAPLVSISVVTLLYHYIGREYLGADENKYWNALRRGILGNFDSFVRKKTSFALTNGARSEEFVGSFEYTSSEFAHRLEKVGYVQCILSGLKERDGKVEAGSMALRRSRSDLLPDVLALYQTHVFWFENEDGSLDVYAHHEYSSLNPLVAWKHYRAVGQDAAKGVERVRKILT